MSTDTVIRKLTAQDINAAAALCADAMIDNPVHVYCFGDHRNKRHERLARFFIQMLAYVLENGLLLGAWQAGELVAIAGALAPGGCRPTWRQRITMGWRLITGNSPLGVLRTANWLNSWLRADPDKPHWHLGPLAVRADWQGKGFVTRLARPLIAEAATQQDAPFHLETDKWRNVRLYQAYGFDLVGKCRIAGYPTWLMSLPPTKRLARQRQSHSL